MPYILKTKYEKPFFSPKEISKILGINHRVVLRWIATNKLPATNVGMDIRATYRISANDLENFIKKNNKKTREKYELEKPKQSTAANPPVVRCEGPAIPDRVVCGEDSPGLEQEDKEIELSLQD